MFRGETIICCFQLVLCGIPHVGSGPQTIFFDKNMFWCLRYYRSWQLIQKSKVLSHKLLGDHTKPLFEEKGILFLDPVGGGGSNPASPILTLGAFLNLI